MANQKRTPSHAILLLCLSAQLIGTLHASERRYRLCGGQLSSVMASVCREHGYNGGRKRAGSALEERRLSDFGLIWQPGSKSYGIRSRQRRGITDECCHQACSMSTLQSYCRVPHEWSPTELEAIVDQMIAPGLVYNRTAIDTSLTPAPRGSVPKTHQERFVTHNSRNRDRFFVTTARRLSSNFYAGEEE
nr:IRP-1 [Urechis unicinctus]